MKFFISLLVLIITLASQGFAAAAATGIMETVVVRAKAAASKSLKMTALRRPLSAALCARAALRQEKMTSQPLLNWKKRMEAPRRALLEWPLIASLPGYSASAALGFGTHRFTDPHFARARLQAQPAARLVGAGLHAQPTRNLLTPTILHTLHRRFLSSNSNAPQVLGLEGDEFANPTTDTGFKQLLSPAIEGNKEIIKSFLNTFVPDFAHDPVASVEEVPVAIPVLPGETMKQTFMDMHVVAQSGTHYVIEMQAQRHIYFDERALYYACATYAAQINSEKELKNALWYRKLRPVIAIQVLGYDSNRVRQITDSEITDTLAVRVKGYPLPEASFIKHYILKDEHSGQQIKHLQMIQLDLPRVTKALFPPQKDFSLQDWWLSVLKFAPHYKHAQIEEFKKQGILMPDVIRQALERLYFPKWNPKIIKEYKSDNIEREKYATMFAVERIEAKVEIVRAMVAKKFSLKDISEVTNLPIEKIKELVANDNGKVAKTI